MWVVFKDKILVKRVWFWFPLLEGFLIKGSDLLLVETLDVLVWFTGLLKLC